MILPAWFDHLEKKVYREESFSYEVVKFQKCLPPAKTSCPSAENVNETSTAVHFVLEKLKH